MVDADSALPGRDDGDAGAGQARGAGHAAEGPVPARASRRRSSAWAASGAPSGSSGKRRASTRRPSATRAGSRRTRPTRRSAAGAPATPRPCSSPSTAEQTSFEDMLKLFWEGHDPTQGMRQGNDVGTQYRSAIYWHDEAQRDAAEASRERYQAMLDAAGLRRDHDRDRPGRARSTTPRTTTSSTSRRTRTATAASAAPASAARSGSTASS